MLRARTGQADATVARLPTQVDYENASGVGAQCADLINQGYSTLVLDASEVQYLDSSGVSMIIMLSRLLDKHAGTLRLAGLSDDYQHVWRLLGLDTVFPVFPTVNAALNEPTTGDGAGTPASLGPVGGEVREAPCR
ncbi:STAS domain-containing protein [Streptomyces sp. NPDC040750]|uniref:STAS domain-containing protein n=1 Tax=Streptomyces sp. NPDC040750 TaxID=3154491 RepID=UPI00340E62B8